MTNIGDGWMRCRKRRRCGIRTIGRFYDHSHCFIQATTCRRLKGERVFLEKGAALAAIDTVENFRCLRQVSAKNPYDFNFSMAFADQAAYDAYNQHPEHQAFVQNVWLPEVEDFLEADFVEMGEEQTVQ